MEQGTGVERQKQHSGVAGGRQSVPWAKSSSELCGTVQQHRNPSVADVRSPRQYAAATN